MTTIEVSKKDIIKALETEPKLFSGAWALTKRRSDAGLARIKVADDCRVCAVGAVMRSVLAPTQPAKAIVRAALAATDGAQALTYADYAKVELRAGRPMAALSCVFEFAELRRGWFDKEGEAGRAAATAFVKEHFPKRIRIDIDGARPRKGVKVIK